MNINITKDIKPASQFRLDPASVFRQVRENHRPVLVTDRGKPSVVIMDAEDYERQREKMELMEAVLEGEKDFQEGRSKSLKEVFRETRKWLEKS